MAIDLGAKPPPKRTELKRAAILAGATEVFLENGYGGASMDEVAARARVSKRTLYHHFASKRALFAATTTRLYSDILSSHDLDDDFHTPVREILTRLAKKILNHLRRKEILGLVRLVIAERERLPEVAEIFTTAGKGLLVGYVESIFCRQVNSGRLNLADPMLAARAFLGAIKENAFWPLYFGLPIAEEERTIDMAVSMILALSQTREAPPSKI